MKRVAFLRAVNVGKRTARSVQLTAAVQGLGYEDVWTHINSGNVVFESTGARGALERRLEEAFEAALGFEATTFVRSAVDLRRAVAAKPFVVGAGDTHFVTFLKDKPTAAQTDSERLSPRVPAFTASSMNSERWSSMAMPTG